MAKITKLGLTTRGKSGKSVMKRRIKTNKNQLKVKEGLLMKGRGSKKN
ncbi:hypothetical protein JMG10_02835 [Nostoc ellipsosporum NOK]|nr:hypothetical protein [Nostoc ellipsosporum NOK]